MTTKTMNDEEHEPMMKELAKAQVEAEKNAKEVNKFKEQYAEWINEFGEDIKNGNVEEVKKGGRFVKFLKKFFNLFFV